MPNIDRIESLANVPALDKEFKFILGNLKEVKASIASLDQVSEMAKTADTLGKLRVVTEKLNDTNKKRLADDQRLIEIQKQLEQVYSNENKTLKQVIVGIDDYTQSQRDLLDIAAKNQIANNLLTEQKKILAKQFREGTIDQNEYKESLSGIINQQKQLAVISKSTNVAINNINQAFAASDGSLEKLRAELNLSLQAFDKLSGADKGSDIGAGLVKKIQDLTQEVTKQEQITGRFQRNVGNYANSLAGGFDKVRDEIKRLTADYQKLQQEQQNDPAGFTSRGGEAQIRKTAAAIDQLNNVLEIGNKGNISYEKSVRMIERAYQNMAASGNVSNEFLQEFKKFAAEAKDNAGDLREEIKAMASDTRQLDLLVGTVSVFASVFEAASGAAALLGKNEEDVQRITQKLVAIQSVANGIREVGEQITKKGTAANIAYNFVLKQTQILFGSGATAASRFGAALKLTGVGLLVTGIGYLIDKMNIFGSTTKDAAEEADRLNQALESIYQTEKDLIDLLAKDPGINNQLLLLKRQLALQQAAGSSQVSLFNTKKKIAEEENKLADKQLQDLILRAETEEFRTDATITGLDAVEQAQQHYYDATVAGEIQLNKMRRVRERDAEKMSETELKAYDDEIKKQEVYIARTQANYNDYTSIIGNAVQKQQALDEVIQTERTRRSEQLKKDTLALAKFQQNLIIENNKKILESEISGRTQKVDAARETAMAQRQIVIDQYNFDLKNKDLTNKQKELLDLQYTTDIEKIESDLSRKILDIQLDAEIKKRQMIEETKEWADQVSAELGAKEKERLDRRIELVEQNLQQRLDVLQIGNDIEIAKINDLYARRKISKEQFEKKQLEIEKKYMLEGLEAQLDHDEQLLIASIQDDGSRLKAEEKYGDMLVKLQGKDAYERLELELQYYEHVLEASNVTGQALIDAEKKIAEIRRKIKEQQVADSDEETKHTIDNLEKLKNTYNDIAGLFSNIIEAQTTAKKNAIQDQINELERLTAAELEQVQNSVASEQEKADKTVQIQAKAQAQKELLQQRQRDLDRKKAVFDKANAIAQIILGTAIAVANAKTLFEAIARAALGAAQLAIAISTPIPKFREGTKGKPFKGGLAYVGDGGKSEGIKLPDGSVLKSPATSTLVYLPAGTEIDPDYSQMIANSAISEAPEFEDNPLHVVDNGDEIRLMRMEIVKAIKSKRELNLETSEAGLSAMWKYGSNNVSYIEQQTRWNKR